MFSHLKYPKNYHLQFLAVFAGVFIIGCVFSSSDEGEGKRNEGQDDFNTSSAYGISSSSIPKNYSPYNLIGKSLILGQTAYTNFSSTGTCSFDYDPITLSSQTKWTIQGNPTCHYTRLSDTTALFNLSYSEKATTSVGYILVSNKTEYSLVFTSNTGGTYKYNTNRNSNTILPSNPRYNTSTSSTYSGHGLFVVTE